VTTIHRHRLIPRKSFQSGDCLSKRLRNSQNRYKSAISRNFSYETTRRLPGSSGNRSVKRRGCVEVGRRTWWNATAMRVPFLKPLLLTGTLWAVPACGFAEADLATWLASKPGTLHAAPDHPWLQEVTFNTRLHWQYAWVSGHSDGNEFWYENGGEFRRFYFGPTVRFLDLFTLKADANLVADESPGGGDLKFGYDSMFELFLTADLSRFIDSARRRFLQALLRPPRTTAHGRTRDFVPRHPHGRAFDARCLHPARRSRAREPDRSLGGAEIGTPYLLRRHSFFRPRQRTRRLGRRPALLADLALRPHRPRGDGDGGNLAEPGGERRRQRRAASRRLRSRRHRLGALWRGTMGDPRQPHLR
jgi:hypothetical protein